MMWFRNAYQMLQFDLPQLLIIEITKLSDFGVHLYFIHDIVFGAHFLKVLDDLPARRMECRPFVIRTEREGIEDGRPVRSFSLRAHCDASMTGSHVTCDARVAINPPSPSDLYVVSESALPIVWPAVGSKTVSWLLEYGLYSMWNRI